MFKEREEKFRESEFWKNFKQDFLLCLNVLGWTGRQVDLVSYGIGFLSKEHCVLDQLALACVLQEELKGSHWSFDPAYTSHCCKFLQDLHISVISENEQCKRLAENPTVFFLPHVDATLANNLLWKNWTSENLENLIVIATSFSTLTRRIPDRILERDLWFIKQASSLCVEIPMKLSERKSEEYFLAFNDISVHCFPHDHICCASIVPHPEPVYVREPIRGDA